MLTRSGMPYLNCPDCGLTVYSAAAYSTSDNCPRCSAALLAVRRPPRLAVPEPGDDRAEPARPVERRSPARPPDLEVHGHETEYGMRVDVRGELMYPAAARLESVLEQFDSRAGRLVVDLRSITALDSSGLSALLATYVRSRQQSFELIVVAPRAPFRRIFELTAVDQWLTLVDDLDAVSEDGPSQ